MGYYTEFVFSCELKEDTPKEIIEVLNGVINEDNFLGLQEKVIFHSEDVIPPEINHPFFKCERWYMLFLSTNWDEEMQGGVFCKDSLKLSLQTEFKNYDDEIDNFITWISPYIKKQKEDQYLGYWKGDNMELKFDIYF